MIKTVYFASGAENVCILTMVQSSEAQNQRISTVKMHTLRIRAQNVCMTVVGNDPGFHYSCIFTLHSCLMALQNGLMETFWKAPGATWRAGALQC